MYYFSLIKVESTTGLHVEKYELEMRSHPGTVLEHGRQERRTRDAGMISCIR